jgi:hypothetical protein
VGVGGEWGGSLLLSMKWAQTNAHRGFITSCPQLGGPAGALPANIAVLVFSRISGDQFLVWGWRIPFMLSIIMVGIGSIYGSGFLGPPCSGGWSPKNGSNGYRSSKRSSANQSRSS